MGAVMNKDRIGQDEAERILRDAAGGPRPGQDPLTAFLAAAAAPPSDNELTGEEAAVSAFRRARLRPARRPLIARVLTVKSAVVVGLCATVIGGVALAAGTGTLPGPIGDERPASHRTSVPPSSPHPSSPSPGGAGGGGAPTSAPPSATPEPTPSRTSTPSPTAQSNGNGNGNGKGKAKGRNKKPKKSKKPHPKKTKAST
jgi:hypothetical protein